jgi:DICT domain-containing protein
MGATPYEVIARHSHVRQATKPMLVAISKHLESEAAGLSSPGVLLSAFQDRPHVTPATIRRYERLADRCVLVAALGMGLSTEPMAGVRGARLETSDPLVGEWSVLVVGAHFAGGLVALDLGDSGPEAGRRFDYVLTHDRNLVLAGAQTLLARIAPT